MPTKLTKPVTRETLRTKDRRGRSLVVTLEASETISFRSKGGKTKVSVALGHVLNLAKIFAAQDMYAQKMKRYKLRKKLGQRTKKPKMVKLPYSDFYFKALGQ